MKLPFCIGRFTYRVELYFSDDFDKVLIDTMAQFKEQIQSSHHGLIEWERLENKKASRIKFKMPAEIKKSVDGGLNDDFSLHKIAEWYVLAMKNFYNAVYPYWEKVQRD